jgi:phosphoglycerol geranylgeranyltransferase
MNFGKVERYLREKKGEHGCYLMTLIDPPDQTPEKAGKMAREAEEGGADVILVGGSASAQGEILDNSIIKIKEHCSLPVLLFPGNIGTTSKHADAIYFMSLLNSRNPYWISQAQVLAAPLVKKAGIEAIPTAYLVIEPGQAVGYIGDANLLHRDKPYIAAQYALAGEMLGSRIILTDSGSGAPTPIDPSFAAIVRKALSPDTLYHCGGGIRTPEQAAELVKAGVNGIQVGTAFEGVTDMKTKVERFAHAMRAEGKKMV